MYDKVYPVLRVSGYAKCKHKVSFGAFSDYGYFKIEDEIFCQYYSFIKEFEYMKKKNIKSEAINSFKQYEYFFIISNYFDYLKEKYGNSFEFECYFHIRYYRISSVNSLNYFYPLFLKGLLKVIFQERGAFC